MLWYWMVMGVMLVMSLAHVGWVDRHKGRGQRGSLRVSKVIEGSVRDPRAGRRRREGGMVLLLLRWWWETGAEVMIELHLGVATGTVVGLTSVMVLGMRVLMIAAHGQQHARAQSTDVMRCSTAVHGRHLVADGAVRAGAFVATGETRVSIAEVVWSSNLALLLKAGGTIDAVATERSVLDGAGTVPCLVKMSAAVVDTETDLVGSSKGHGSVWWRRRLRGLRANAGDTRRAASLALALSLRLRA